MHTPAPRLALANSTSSTIEGLVERGRIADKAIRDAGGPPDDFDEGL
jgi:hypothetical protein